jgi:hypothetical protein
MDSIKVRKEERQSKVKRQKGINIKSRSEFLQNGISKINLASTYFPMWGVACDIPPFFGGTVIIIK